MTLDASRVRILYTNHRGETAWRLITPQHIFYGSTIHHPVCQWLLQAHDHDKQDDRTFAIKDIHQWEAVT